MKKTQRGKKVLSSKKKLTAILVSDIVVGEDGCDLEIQGNFNYGTAIFLTYRIRYQINFLNG